MQHSLHVHVFDHNGVWGASVYRVYPSAGRRYARREHLLGLLFDPGTEMGEFGAVQLAIKALQGVSDRLE